MSAAPFLSPPRRPPHDPLWIPLGGHYGWRIAPASLDVTTDICDGALVLAPKADAGRFLAEPSGAFGGLSLPGHVTIDAHRALWLLDRKSGLLKRFDDCACGFVSIPCTAGLGSGARQLVKPGSIAARGLLLLLTDSGPPGRLLVFDRRSFALRAIWQMPPGVMAQPWRPGAIVIDRTRVLVADANNGVIHVFSPLGGWKEALTGFGAVVALTVDGEGRLYTLAQGDSKVRISTPDGQFLGEAERPDEISGRFPCPSLPVAADGSIDLTDRCAGAGWFDPSGATKVAPATSESLHAASGIWLSRSLDSRISRCIWHAVRIEADLPGRCALAFSVFTADAELPDTHIDALPDSAWKRLPSIPPGGEALIQAPPGRYLWLRCVLTGTGTQTPRLRAVQVEFPRISLRRYLPAAFGADVVSADFTDRLLGVFDRGFRDIEATIDDQASLFDPRSASTGKGVPDMLGALAKWVGVALDPMWSTARKRVFLAQAPALFASRGTVPGLRDLILAYLGFDRRDCAPAPASCSSRCAPAPSPWQPPTLILEHWKLRRWMFLGAGRIGDAAVLWGHRLLGRSRLDDTAQTGVTRLDAVRDPLRDPFHMHAHQFSVFVPAHVGRSARARASLHRLVERNRPAHASSRLVFVEPRMRIGIQSSIGLDAVVGCWPSGINLAETRLGVGSVLPATGNEVTATTLGRAVIQEERP